MVNVVARVALHYDGRAIAAGERFGAEPIDALVLRAQGKVTWARLEFYRPDPVPPPPAPDPPKRRRTYRRRDLVADSAVTPEE